MDADELVARFMTEGRLRMLPAKAAKRAIVLEKLAGLFEPGVRYSVRRYLVDHQLLDRDAGEYWRVGGWVEGS